MILDQGFTDEFIEQFSKEGFYATPNKTKINIYLDGKKTLVGNAVVANLEQTNEKIPIYSYNSPTYSKYLNGRQLISGKIGLRKITVAQFIKMLEIDKTNIENKKEITELEKEIKELEDLISKTDKKIVPNGLKKILLSKQVTAKKLIDMVNKNQISEAVQFQMDDVNTVFDNDELLYYLDNTDGDNRLKIVINFENNYGTKASPYIALKDVLFIRKQTEINVGRGDIIEFYDFIGNPSFNRSANNE